MPVSVQKLHKIVNTVRTKVTTFLIRRRLLVWSGCSCKKAWLFFLILACPDERGASGWVSLEDQMLRAFCDWVFMEGDWTNEIQREHTSF